MLTGTSHISSRAASVWRSWGIPLAVIGALTALFGAVNWHWLQQNVVTYGWDRMDHLITSLVYNDMMRSFSPRTPFDLLSFSSYYPPLFHFNVVGLYRFFGVDEDVAAMANVGYLAILLGATWSIARRLAGSWTALLATFLLGAFPMIFAMSRYLYVDFALTSLVAASMACLLYGERFQRRGFSLCFGLALGFAFLTKWTAAAFLIGSLLYIVWRSGMWMTVLRRPHLLLPNPRRAAIILTVSAGLNLLWLYPARDSVANSALGWWVYPMFTVMAACALYALVAPDPPGQKDAACALRNGLRAAAVSAWLISLWYVLNPEFADHFAFTAYGREEPFMAFGKYFQEIALEQVGLVLALLFAAVAIIWTWQQRGRFLASLRGLSDTAWVLVLWVVVPYFIFSFRVTLAHSRFVMPLLPPFAIWLAVGLAQWRPRWLRAIAIAGAVVFAVVQFAAISFDGLADWRPHFIASVGDRSVDLLAHGFFIQYPTSKRTDPGYAVAPEILSLVDEARQAQDKETINLGLLVNSYQLHEKHFLYQIYKSFPQVRLRELARNWNETPAYNQLFEMDYVLVSDRHTFRTSEASQLAVARILQNPADMFNQAFTPVRRWTLPNGERLTLYARRFAPVDPGVATDDMLALLTYFGDQLGPGDAVVLTSPDLVYLFGLALPAEAGGTIVPLPPPNAAPAATIAALEELARTHQRLFLVRHNAEKSDPASVIERWLHDHTITGGDAWAKAVQVTPFVPVEPAATRLLASGVNWPDGVTLQSAVQVYPAGLGPSPVAGGALVTELEWAGDVTGRKASLQLLAPDGRLVAQNDRETAPGRQASVLLIPRSAAPGDYRLTLTLYDPVTLQRYALAEGAESITLGAITVAPNAAQAVHVNPDLLAPPDQGEDDGT